MVTTVYNVLRLLNTLFHLIIATIHDNIRGLCCFDVQHVFFLHILKDLMKCGGEYSVYQIANIQCIHLFKNVFMNKCESCLSTGISFDVAL